MLDFMDSRHDVIAIRLSHKITGSDLDAIMSRIDDIMARHPKVHVFVETQAINGIELTGLPANFTRAMPLFGKLDRFGRVAVVADQPWVRFGTRFESAILPSISYRTFSPNQRDEALAWVEGEHGCKS